MPPTGTGASMVPPRRWDGDLRDDELEKAKPSPGDSGIAAGPRVAGDGEGWRVGQNRASSGSTFPAAVPVEARWRQGHSPSLGAQGWESTPR